MEISTLFIIPAIDWLGGPENRLHRLFERINLPFNSIEVLNINLVKKKIRSTKLKIFNPVIIKPYGKTAFFYMLNIVILWINIIRRIIKTNVKTILSTNPILSIPVVFLKKFFKIKHIFDYVDDISELAKEYTPSILEKPIVRVVKFMEKTVIRHSNKLIVSSRYLEHCIRMLTKKKPIYIPNGVDISFFSKRIKKKKKNSPIIGYVGGIYDWAGIEDFIGTYPIVSNKIPDVKYHIYGTGDTDEKITKLAGNYNNIEFFGLIPYEEVPKIMSTFTIGLIPFKKSSLTDAACPIKLFEYWASKVPVVSRNLNEIQRISPKSCLFFKNTNDLAKILINTLLNNGLREDLINRGFSNVSEYDWEKLSKKYFKILKD